MLVLSSPTGWKDHALGLGALIEAQGPNMFTHKPALSLFESTRFFIILASMAASKKTFLSRPEWKSIPWSRSPFSKSRMQYLLDTFSELASLKEDLKIGVAPELLYFRAMEVFHNLTAWRATWDDDLMESTSRLPDHGTYPANSLLQFRLLYATLDAANCVCLYDAGLIQVVEILRATGENKGLTDPSPFDFLALAHKAAIEICESIQYQLEELSHAMLGQLLVLYPLRMAWKVFNWNLSPEKKLIESILQKISMTEHKWKIAEQTLQLTEYHSKNLKG